MANILEQPVLSPRCPTASHELVLLQFFPDVVGVHAFIRATCSSRLAVCQDGTLSGGCRTLLKL